MATIQTEPDSPDNLLYIHIAGYRGYKQDILTLNLSKLEIKLLICTECDGIIKEAVFCEGKTICTSCTAGKPHEPNDDVRESVNELNVICPLNYRGCKWKGELLQLEQHLLQCDHLLILCNQECSTILAQYGLIEHNTKSCPMRILPCEFCKDLCLAKNVNNHLTKCPAYILDCPQGCMERVRRDNMNEHTEIHCEMKKEPCLYHEFGCKTNSIAKRDVQTHQQEYVVSHQECLYQQIQISKKDVSKLNIVTRDQSKQMQEVNNNVNQLTDKSNRNDIQLELLRADSIQLENICSRQKEQIIQLDKVCGEQKGLIIKFQKVVTKNNQDVDSLKSSLATQKQISNNLQKLVVKQITYNKALSTSLTVIKLQMGQELTSTEFEFFEKFEWEITDVMNSFKRNLRIESPIFGLYDHNLQCQAIFYHNGVFKQLDIRIRSITDKAIPQRNQFCYHQVQLINRNNENISICKKGKIDRLIKGDYMQIAFFDNFIISPFLQKDSFLIRIQLIPTQKAVENDLKPKS
ncbi:TNF receptor-associated factor 4-like [Oopsacas minuta]|uniref:TNF receptor-associated factor 4-like n=1 Tax=Oopsacas minuta TaxID=111878 RepID=A0AAV7JL67_9METZ|nr:TNF receptor-associated factor 4-like [Oopsacas minuta]